MEKHINKNTYPNGFDVVVDATGIPSVIETAFEYLGKTAKYLQFGVTSQDARVTLDPFKLYNNDWTVLGSMAINYTFIPAFHWVKEGRIKIDHLISKKFHLKKPLTFYKDLEIPACLKYKSNYKMIPLV